MQVNPWNSNTVLRGTPCKLDANPRNSNEMPWSTLSEVNANPWNFDEIQMVYIHLANFMRIHTSHCDYLLRWHSRCARSHMHNMHAFHHQFLHKFDLHSYVQVHAFHYSSYIHLHTPHCIFHMSTHIAETP